MSTARARTVPEGSGHAATALARRGRAAVRVRGPQALLARLGALLAPYVTLDAAGEPARWTVEARQEAPAAAATQPGWRQHVVESPWEPARHVAVGPSGLLRVHEADPDWLLQQVLRAVRNLLRWEHRRLHATTFAHGGHVLVGGHGVTVLGPKAAGKTTVILACMALLGARLVANDDVELAVSGGGVAALGWPRSVVVRAGTLAALAREGVRLAPEPARLSHPANRRNAPAPGQDPEHVWFTPAELCAAAGSSPEPTGAVTALVFPRRVDGHGSPQAELTPLSRRSAARALARNVEHAPDAYDRFLADHFTAPGAARTTASVGAITRAVPGFELRYRRGRLGPLAEVLAGGLAR